MLIHNIQYWCFTSLGISLCDLSLVAILLGVGYGFPESVSVSVVSDTGVIDALALALVGSEEEDDIPSMGVACVSYTGHISVCEALGIAPCEGGAARESDDGRDVTVLVGGGRAVLLWIAPCC